MPRVKQSQGGRARHDPLLVQLKEDEVAEKYGKISQPGKRKKSKKGTSDDEETGTGEVILDPKTSRKIFELAQEQQDELDVQPDDEDELVDAEDTQIRTASGITEDFSDEEIRDDDQEEVEEVEEFEIDADDLNTLDTLLPPNRGERRTLADIIFAKLDSANATEPVSSSGNAAVIQNVRQEDPDHPDPALGLDPRVVETFEKLGTYLRGYKSGSLPKIFKVIPTLPTWARVLALTSPENWSPQAAYAATRIFISTMKPNQAQLFLSVVLLDAVREDIRNQPGDGRGKAGGKKLNVHYYNALKRALYKPAAFFKGIVFPMLDQGCTLKEAAIIASILSTTKIPALHSSAAMLRIAEMEYSGPNSLFLRVLIDKKYELPYKVVDALVFHFIRLSNTYKKKNRGDADQLPVLWHQSLLVFVQRYASDLTPDQKDALLDVIRANPHPQISSEVRRELVSSVVRGAPRQDAEGDVEMS